MSPPPPRRPASRRPRSLVVGLGLVGLLAGPAAAGAQDDVLTPARVNAAIDKGVRWLSSQRNAGGHWEGLHNNYEGGVTALVTLALLTCDVPATDPRVRDALAYLRTLDPRDTYVVGLQTMVFAAATPKQDFRLIERNAKWLVGSRLDNGKWSYGARQLGGGDTSNTQYALLGLNAAAEAGVKIDNDFWADCRRFWTAKQNPQGSWGYPDYGNTASMTVGGISSLVITGRQLGTAKAGRFDGKQVRCNGPRDDEPLQRAVNWLGRNFSVTNNMYGNQHYLYYYLYGLERAGRLTGRRFFGGDRQQSDWYRAGTRFLLNEQEPRGSWSHGGWEAKIDTAFALLFLGKGRIPILMNKLEYGVTADWNNSPNDVNNLTSYVGKLWQKPLNWQTVAVDVANVEDLMQAPLLQFSGHDVPRFTDAQVRKLRGYVEQGGTIVADSNCSTEAFDRGFRELVGRMFPEPEQRLQPLEPDHGVWSSLFKLPANWPLQGVNVGCRTAVFYSPEDMSCSWEHPSDPTSQAAFRLGANIVAYAVGPEQLLDKLDKRDVVADTPEEALGRNYLRLAKLKHNGDWNLAPRAVRNLMTTLRTAAKVDVELQQRETEILDRNLINYPLAYMHGRTRYVLSEKEKDRLLDYLKNGGMLFADSCCASEAFDKSFREMCKQLFPNQALRRLPPDHELFSTAIGFDLRSVRYSAALGGREGPPELEAVEVDGRVVVVYSRLDLGCAMDKQQSRDCRGYAPEAALRIAANIVLYCLKQ